MVLFDSPSAHCKPNNCAHKLLQSQCACRVYVCECRCGCEPLCFCCLKHKLCRCSPCKGLVAILQVMTLLAGSCPSASRRTCQLSASWWLWCPHVIKPLVSTGGWLTTTHLREFMDTEVQVLRAVAAIADELRSREAWGQGGGWCVMRTIDRGVKGITERVEKRAGHSAHVFACVVGCIWLLEVVSNNGG